MTKYKIIVNCPDSWGTEMDEVFDTEEEAEEYGLYCCSCYRLGMETLNMSNPGDYPFDEDNDEADFEVIEIDA